MNKVNLKNPKNRMKLLPLAQSTITEASKNAQRIFMGEAMYRMALEAQVQKMKEGNDTPR